MIKDARTSEEEEDGASEVFNRKSEIRGKTKMITRGGGGGGTLELREDEYVQNIFGYRCRDVVLNAM